MSSRPSSIGTHCSPQEIGSGHYHATSLQFTHSHSTTCPPTPLRDDDDDDDDDDAEDDDDDNDDDDGRILFSPNEQTRYSRTCSTEEQAESEEAPQ